MAEKISSKPTLSETQQWMSQAILSSAASLEIATVPERLGVYSSAYIIRLTEVLQSDFKALHAVLGEEAFSRMVVEYLKAYPSRYSNIGEVGIDLSRFLKSHALTQATPFLSSLASLEWDICESFWADDLPPSDFSKLQSLSEEEWGNARFKLDSSVKLVQSDWPILEVWKSSCDEKALSAPTIPQKPLSEWLMLHRDTEGEVQVTALEAAAFESLRRLRQGVTLGELFESTQLQAKFSSEEITEARVQTWFQEWIQNGIIREIILNQPA